MQLLVSGGNHVLQGSVVDQLTAAGHGVRVVTSGFHPRRTTESAQAAPVIVNGSSVALLAGSLHECDAVVHIDSSISAEDGADVRLRPDVEHIVNAAVEARLRRLIVVVAPERASAIESALQRSTRAWLVLRCAPVYGTGNDPLSRFLVMMRSLPVVPLLGDQHVLRPVWHQDLAAAIVASLSLDDQTRRRRLDIAGPDAITDAELYERLSALTGRHPLRVPIPEFLATHGPRLASALGVALPGLVAATAAETFDPAPDLEQVLGVRPLPLSDGLRRLVLELDEMIPSDGVGRVQLKHFFAVIEGSPLGPAELLEAFRRRFAEMMPSPVGVEPIAPGTELTPDAVLTIGLPGRGHVQVRVEDVTPERVVLATLRGHTIAGFVRFTAVPAGRAVRFEVTTCDAAANALDWITLSIGGSKIQDANWTRVVENVIALSGGRADGVHSDARTLNAAEAAAADRWIAHLIDRD
jgi:uncharacterized protein YbjT (DUF2867 family)